MALTAGRLLQATTGTTAGDGPEVTGSVGTPGSASKVPTEEAVRTAIDNAGVPLIVEESGGSPQVADVAKIIFEGATVSEPSANVANVKIPNNGIIAGNFIGAVITKTTSQTVANSGTVTFDKIISDTGGIADLANNRLLIVEEGYYIVGGQLETQSQSGNNWANPVITTSNPTPLTQRWDRNADSSSFSGLGNSFPQLLSPGDTIELSVTGDASFDVMGENVGVGTILWAIKVSDNNAVQKLLAPALYNKLVTQPIPNDVDTVINFENLISDDDTLVTTGAGWNYEATRDAIVFVNASIMFDATALTDGEILRIRLRKNGTVIKEFLYEVEAPETEVITCPISAAIPVTDGDTIDAVGRQNSGVTINLNVNLSNGSRNYIDIFEIPKQKAAQPQWQAFTPVSNWDANLTWDYAELIDHGNKRLEFKFQATLTSAPTGTFEMTIPLGRQLDSSLAINENAIQQFDGLTVRETGVISYPGRLVNKVSDATKLLGMVFLASNTYLSTSSLTPTVPFTLASGDRVIFHGIIHTD